MIITDDQWPILNEPEHWILVKTGTCLAFAILYMLKSIFSVWDKQDSEQKT